MMPVESCTADGKPGHRWGDSGKCYTYEPGDALGKAEAKEKAREQGAAIERSPGWDKKGERDKKKRRKLITVPR